MTASSRPLKCRALVIRAQLTIGQRIELEEFWRKFSTRAQSIVSEVE
jgi:hypothetical protein